jgi:hypothetical protein
MENTQPVERRVRARYRTAGQWFAVLVAAAAIAVLGPVVFRRIGSGNLPQTKMLLATAARSDSTIEILLAQPIWSETLGDGEGPLSAEARAVRLGAAIAELELRHRRADSSARAIAESAARLLETFPRAGDAANAFRALGATTNDSALRAAAGMAEQVAGARAVRVGAWLQSARFAAATADSSPFDPPMIRGVSRAAVTIDDRAETEYAVRQFEDVARERPRNWTAIATSVDELLRLLGTR